MAEDFEGTDENRGARDLVRLRLITTHNPIVTARKAKGWTQIELAREAGVSLSHLRKIENLRRCPSDSEQQDIAGALGQPAGDLFPDSLLTAVRLNVFHKRTAVLQEPQIMSLTEAVSQHLLPEGVGEDGIIEAIEANPESRHGTGRIIEDVLSSLKPQERLVIELRFGFEDGNGMTLEEIGRRIGRCRERVRQIEAKALRKLRHPSRSRGLKDFAVSKEDLTAVEKLDVKALREVLVSFKGTKVWDKCPRWLRTAVVLLYGVEDGKEHSLNEVANQLKLEPGRVESLAKRGLEYFGILTPPTRTVYR